MNNANPDHTDIDRIHSAVRREKADLPSGKEAAPMWAIFISFLVAMIGGGELGNALGYFSIESKPKLGALVDPRLQDGGPGEQLDPLALAKKKGGISYAVCGGCHQASGMGVPGQFPPLAGSEIVIGGTERLARIALHGLVGPVTVKGANYNMPGGMPPQGIAMSDGDIANVLSFIRNSWGNEGSLVTKEMVAKVREAEKGRTTQWTMADLESHAKADIPGAEAAPAPAAKAK